MCATSSSSLAVTWHSGTPTFCDGCTRTGVNRKMSQSPCFWTKQGCDPRRIAPKVLTQKPHLELSGFLLHPFCAPRLRPTRPLLARLAHRRRPDAPTHCQPVLP